MLVIRVKDAPLLGEQWERARRNDLIRYQCGEIGAEWYGGLWPTEMEAHQDARGYLAFGSQWGRVEIFAVIVDAAERTLHRVKIAEVWPTLLI